MEEPSSDGGFVRFKEVITHGPQRKNETWIDRHIQKSTNYLGPRFYNSIGNIYKTDCPQDGNKMNHFKKQMDQALDIFEDDNMCSYKQNALLHILRPYI